MAITITTRLNFRFIKTSSKSMRKQNESHNNDEKETGLQVNCKSRPSIV